MRITTPWLAGTALLFLTVAGCPAEAEDTGTSEGTGSETTSAMTMTSERSKVVDFVAPYFDQSGISIITSILLGEYVAGMISAFFTPS